MLLEFHSLHNHHNRNYAKVTHHAPKGGPAVFYQRFEWLCASIICTHPHTKNDIQPYANHMHNTTNVDANASHGTLS
jgi:hypothetical protein